MTPVTSRSLTRRIGNRPSTQPIWLPSGSPRLVYLSPSADGDATGTIELGRLKADTWNQNYIVPSGALDDPASAASVVIWCKQFNHLFATAPLDAG
jgi:hypothetical protein